MLTVQTFCQASECYQVYTLSKNVLLSTGHKAVGLKETFLPPDLAKKSEWIEYSSRFHSILCTLADCPSLLHYRRLRSSCGIGQVLKGRNKQTIEVIGSRLRSVCGILFQDNTFYFFFSYEVFPLLPVTFFIYLFQVISELNTRPTGGWNLCKVHT